MASTNLACAFSKLLSTGSQGSLATTRGLTASTALHQTTCQLRASKHSGATSEPPHPSSFSVTTMVHSHWLPRLLLPEHHWRRRALVCFSRAAGPPWGLSGALSGGFALVRQSGALSGGVALVRQMRHLPSGLGAQTHSLPSLAEVTWGAPGHSNRPRHSRWWAPGRCPRRVARPMPKPATRAPACEAWLSVLEEHTRIKSPTGKY